MILLVFPGLSHHGCSKISLQTTYSVHFHDTLVPARRWIRPGWGTRERGTGEHCLLCCSSRCIFPSEILVAVCPHHWYRTIGNSLAASPLPPAMLFVSLPTDENLRWRKPCVSFSSVLRFSSVHEKQGGYKIVISFEIQFSSLSKVVRIVWLVRAPFNLDFNRFHCSFSLKGMHQHIVPLLWLPSVSSPRKVEIPVNINYSNLWIVLSISSSLQCVFYSLGKVLYSHTFPVIEYLLITSRGIPWFSVHPFSFHLWIAVDHLNFIIYFISRFYQYSLCVVHFVIFEWNTFLVFGYIFGFLNQK